jgi:hypothetical protein
MPRIYVCGPLFNGHTLSWEEGLVNWEKTAIISEKLMQKGWAPYVPHNSYHMSKFISEHQKRDISFERWMQLDSSWISQCSALYFIGHSKGADRELKYALDNGITVYMSLDEVPEVSPDNYLCPECTDVEHYQTPYGEEDED